MENTQIFDEKEEEIEDKSNLDEIIERITKFKTLGVNIHILPYLKGDVDSEKQDLEYHHEYFEGKFKHYYDSWEKANKYNFDENKCLGDINYMKKAVNRLNDFTELHMFIFRNTKEEYIINQLDCLDNIIREYTKNAEESDIFESLYKTFGTKTKIKRPTEKNEHPEIGKVMFYDGTLGGGQTQVISNKPNAYKQKPNPTKVTGYSFLDQHVQKLKNEYAKAQEEAWFPTTGTITNADIGYELKVDPEDTKYNESEDFDI